MIQAEPFVKRAPDIAEEILQKTASLPEDLRSFTRTLLTKTASTQEEKLEAPKRTTWAELAKIAQENKVVLPEVKPVASEAGPEIAENLKKVAQHHRDETSNDILATAAAIFLEGKKKDAEKAASVAVGVLQKDAAVVELVRRGGGALGRSAKGLLGVPGKAVKAVKPYIPGTESQIKRLTRKAKLKGPLSQAEAKIVGTPQWEAAARARVGRTEALGEAVKARGRREATLKGLGVTAPAIGIGLPAAALATRRRGQAPAPTIVT